nr:hypothetical protein LA636_2788 [Erwinia amylovora LA636]
MTEAGVIPWQPCRQTAKSTHFITDIPLHPPSFPCFDRRFTPCVDKIRRTSHPIRNVQPTVATWLARTASVSIAGLFTSSRPFTAASFTMSLRPSPCARRAKGSLSPLR